MGKPQSSFESGSVLKTVAGGYLLLLTLLLPLKLGVLAVMPEATGYFPDGWFEYLIVSWSSTVMAMAGGVGLLLALAAFPRHLAAFRDPAWRVAAAWSVGLPLLALPGFYGATTLDFPVMQLSHLAGVGAYAAAIYLYLADDPRRKSGLLSTLAVGTLLLGYFGLEQYFWGFERSRQFLIDQQAAGVQLGEALTARTFDTRVFATFTSCNSLAGYLLLLLPVLGATLWKWGGNVEPVKVSRALFLAIGGGAVLAVLLLTKSRAAYLALLATVGVVALCWPMRRRWKVGLIALLILGAVAGAYYIHRHGRGFESMAARADYLRSSAILLARHPVAGVGWGEFFHEHMRIKSIASDEAARDPHNIVMTAAQAGLGLMALLLATLIYPLGLLIRRTLHVWRQERRILLPELAGSIGLIAFYLHSLMDINIQIPAAMGALTALTLALLVEALPDDVPASRRVRIGCTLLPAAVALFAVGSGCHLLRGEIAYDRLNTLCMLRRLGAEKAAKVTPDAVRRALVEAVAARPYSPFPWSSASSYMLAFGNLAEAERFTDEALKRAPKRANLYFRKYQIYSLAGRRTDAAAALAKARELFPNNPLYRGAAAVTPKPY
jgi:hypothetical protein